MEGRRLIKRFFLFTTAMQVGYYGVIYADKNKESLKRQYKKWKARKA